jgi:hypothetical protein
MVLAVDESFTELDQRVEALRAQVREALQTGDRDRARTLRRQLREAERAWHDALAAHEDGEDEHAAGSRPVSAELISGRPVVAGREAVPAAAGPGGMLLPLREQVYQALTLLTVPAAPRLVSAVHEALFAGAIPAGRMTSLRRDEERSFRTAPFARPYYLCPALTADYLAPARGVLAVSTWPLGRRVIGSLSPRVDYLTAAIRIAESIQRIPEPGAAASRLLWRFAVNIPGAAVGAGRMDPLVVVEAARAELAVHADTDAAARQAAAARARQQLDDAQQLFGVRFGTIPQGVTGARALPATRPRHRL